VCCSVLCSTVKELVAKLAASTDINDDLSSESVSSKCSVLNQKLDALIITLHEESQAAAEQQNEVSSDFILLPGFWGILLHLLLTAW